MTYLAMVGEEGVDLHLDHEGGACPPPRRWAVEGVNLPIDGRGEGVDLPIDGRGGRC